MTALNVTIYGLGIVFLTLLVVMFVIMALSRIFAAFTGKDFLVAAPESAEVTSEISAQSTEKRESSPAKAAPPTNAPLVLKSDRAAAPPVAPRPSSTSIPTGQAGVGGSITAPLPGKVLSIAVKAGDSVKKGAELCVIEAMKMSNIIKANQDSTILEVSVSVGDNVPFGVELFRIE